MYSKTPIEELVTNVPDDKPVSEAIAIEKPQEKPVEINAITMIINNLRDSTRGRNRTGTPV